MDLPAPARATAESFTGSRIGVQMATVGAWLLALLRVPELVRVVSLYAVQIDFGEPRANVCRYCMRNVDAAESRHRWHAFRGPPDLQSRAWKYAKRLSVAVQRTSREVDRVLLSFGWDPGTLASASHDVRDRLADRLVFAVWVLGRHRPVVIVPETIGQYADFFKFTAGWSVSRFRFLCRPLTV